MKQKAFQLLHNKRYVRDNEGYVRDNEGYVRDNEFLVRDNEGFTQFRRSIANIFWVNGHSCER
jgi:hypothetical protein